MVRKKAHRLSNVPGQVARSGIFPFWCSIYIVPKQSKTFKSSPFNISPTINLANNCHNKPLPSPPFFPRVGITCLLCYPGTQGPT